MRLIDADALSEWLKDYGQKVIKGERKTSLMYVWKHVQDMPTIEPERKKGKWVSADAIFGGVPFYCNECGENTRDTVMSKPRWKFCPNCGAKMEGVEQE